MTASREAERDVLAAFNLNGDRLRAALTVDRPVLVLAGPGAGKTHLLVAHACRLVQVRTGRVVMMTFTKKAAEEMGRRVTRALDSAESRRVMPTTVHAYALSLLHAHGHRIGLPGKLEPLVGAEVQALADGVAAKHELPAMSDFAKRFERYQRVGGRLDGPNAPALLGLVIGEMRRTGEFDWETSIRFATELLHDHPQVRESVHHHDRSIILDEAQDCDPAQLKFLDEVVGDSGHLFVAMDPDQSLYAFRQADPARVRSWIDRHAPETVELTENFRCMPRIQSLAKRVLGRDSTAGLIGGSAIVCAADTQADEARQVLGELLARRDGTRKVLAKRMAVLARSRTRLAAAEACLDSAGFPFRGSRNAEWDDAEARVVLTLGFLAEWRSAAPVSRAAQPFLQGVLGMSPSDAEAVEEKSLQTGVHPGDAVDHPGWRALSSWFDSSPHSPEDIAKQSADVLALQLTPDSPLLATARQAKTFADFLRSARSGPSDAFVASQDGVFVGTFHGAKGLEFDTVFIVGCEDGTIPDFRTRGAEGELEERRALYVAVTRAERAVFISWARGGPKGHVQQASPFLPAPEDAVWGGDE